MSIKKKRQPIINELMFLQWWTKEFYDESNKRIIKTTSLKRLGAKKSYTKTWNSQLLFPDFYKQVFFVCFKKW